MSQKIAKIVARHILGENVRSSHPDFNPDLDALLALEDILVPINRSLRGLTKAYTNFIKLKIPRITPDGMIGGKGFVMPLRDAKAIVNDAIESLTLVVNAIEDEVSNNPIWQEAKAQREENHQEDVLDAEPYIEEEIDVSSDEEASGFEFEDKITDPFKYETDLNFIPEYTSELRPTNIDKNLEEEMRSP